MADILLEVGISIVSLKAARAQIGAELKSWKFPEAEKAQIIDKKQIADAQKSVKDLGKSMAVNISQAYEPIEEVGKAIGVSSEKLKRLAEVSKFYNLQAEMQGRTLSGVRSELSAYNRALAEGSVTIEQVGHKYGKLSAEYTKLAEEHKKATSGLLAGINLPRLLLWAVGWTALYSVLRGIINVFGEVVSTVSKVTEVMNQVRVVNSQTAAAFNEDYARVRETIFELSRSSIISAKQLAEAFRLLTFEGAKLSLALAALPQVRNLMVITGEKENVVAQALIETYGLFANKLASGVSESEKLARITDLLVALFTRAHVSLAEYQQLMSFIAPTAAESVESYEFLVSLLIYADNAMLSGRRAGMALIQVLTQLTENSQKLAEVFGITFKPRDVITVEKILMRIRDSVRDLTEPEKKDLLSKIFKGAPLELVLKLINETDESIRKLVEDADKLGERLKTGIEKAHPAAIYMKMLWQDIAKAATEAWQKTGEAMEAERQAVRAQAVRERHPGILWELAEEQADAFRKSVEAARRELPLSIVTPEIAKMLKESTDFAIALTQEERKQIALLEQSQRFRLLEAAGASETLLYQTRISDAIQKSVMLIADEETRREAITALEQARVSTYEEIYEIARAQGIEEKQAQELIKEIAEARLEIQLKMYEEIKSLADEIESKTVDFVKNMMTGTANVKDFFQSIVDVYRETFAQKIVQMFGETTGIFAGMAAAFMSPLQRAHYTGVQSAVPLIVQAHINGITQGMAGVQVGAAPTAAKPAGGMSGFLKNISSIFGFGGAKVPTAPTATVAPMAAAGGATQVLIKPEQTAQTSKLAAAGKAAGQALGAAAAIYGGVQGIMAQKGQGKGMGALGGALSGAMAGSMFGPWGMAIGAVVGAIGGLIMGGKKAKAPEPEIRQQTLEIKSAIQISNKELQLVNRNLTGIRRAFEGFWMPRSAYFSERMGVEERFALSSSRGIL